MSTVQFCLVIALLFYSQNCHFWITVLWSMNFHYKIISFAYREMLYNMILMTGPAFTDKKMISERFNALILSVVIDHYALVPGSQERGHSCCQKDYNTSRHDVIQF